MLELAVHQSVCYDKMPFQQSGVSSAFKKKKKKNLAEPSATAKIEGKLSAEALSCLTLTMHRRTIMVFLCLFYHFIYCQSSHLLLHFPSGDPDI